MNQWFMRGTEGTGEYIVVACTALGRVGFRLLDGNCRIRVEPTPGGRAVLRRSLTTAAGWKQPGNGAQDRFSTVVQERALEDCLKIALQAIDFRDASTQMNPGAPDWVRRLLPATANEGNVRQEGRLFISYRRTDSQEVVGRLYDRLISSFSSEVVFRDIDSISIGQPFTDALDDALKCTKVGMVVMGPQWTTSLDSNGRRRLDDPEDFVRLEVESLLSMPIPVIPCLVSHATFPTAKDLPRRLRPLLKRQGVQVRPDPDFHRDVDRLIEELRLLLNKGAGRNAARGG